MAEEPPPMTLQQRIAALNAAHMPSEAPISPQVPTRRPERRPKPAVFANPRQPNHLPVANTRQPPVDNHIPVANTRQPPVDNHIPVANPPVDNPIPVANPPVDNPIPVIGPPTAGRSSRPVVPPPLPARKLPPPLPARKDSEDDSNRRPSVGSAASRSASTDRIKAPAWGECELPALPPPRNASQPRKPSFERTKYVNRAPSSETIVAVAPAAAPAARTSRPPLPPRLPPRKVVVNPVPSPQPQDSVQTSANKSPTAQPTPSIPLVHVTVAQPNTALPVIASLGLQRTQSQPTTTLNSIVPTPTFYSIVPTTTFNSIVQHSPPVPSNFKPDISAIQATKPKLVPKPAVLNSPSQSGASVCLVCRDFSLPDGHATKFPRQTVSSLQDLAYHLTAPFPSATDKARVICTWLHLNIAYDVDNFFHGTVKGSTPESTLQSGLAVCEGYAHLFTRLATYAGLDSVIVDGHGKGFGYATPIAGSAPVPFDGNHAWNAVKIDGGEWKLIDSCWYSGHIQGRGMPYVAKRNDSMFTMSNQEFGIKHFPKNREHFFCQGAAGMTWDEYIQINPDHWPHNVEPPTIFTIAEEEYFIGKQTVAPHSKLISIRQGGNVRFQFGLRCPHWNLAKHTTHGPPPVFLMQIEGRDGRNRDLIPFEHRPATGNSSDLWYVDIPVIDLGAPGQTISCFAVTTVGDSTHCRGLSVAEFKEMKGKIAMGFAGVMAWELVA
ncbi:hypothetical protein DV735_g2448, partial [Chaetothyriales sp. CBS 134920]